MRLFLYYASHSLLNTLKKMMKTWAVIFVIMIVFGGMIGLFGAMLDKSTDKADNTVTVLETDEDGNPGEEISAAEARDGFLKGLMAEHDLAKENIVDLAISAIFLLILAVNIINAKNSNKIFLPADVPMLFASPMRPQSVLMFRLLCTLGSSLLISVFALFQIPNLTINAGLSLWGSFSIIIVYVLSLMFSTLVQVIFYTITSKMKNGVANLNRFIAVVYGAIGVGFAAFVTVNKMDIVDGLFAYFASPKTHWIPFWGWLRAISYYAVAGDTSLSLIFLGIFIASCAVLVLLIWKMKADFYEDAMFAAEHKAEQLEGAKRAARGSVATREKDRKENLDREGFHYGKGASVFFYKAVFNRFRFAKLKIFSTTMIVYTLISGVVAWFARTAPFDDPFFMPAAALGLMAFYRTLGDPIREDTSRGFFVLIPEKGFAKIFYSLLGSLTVTAIDLLVPFIVCAVLVGANPLSVIVWFLFILSISFFATTLGTFISLSLPDEVAKLIGTIIQMIFFYFGLAPSAVAVILGIMFGKLVLAVAIGAAINFAIGLLVTLLLPVFLGRK